MPRLGFTSKVYFRKRLLKKVSGVSRVCMSCILCVVDKSASETCENLGFMSSAETFYETPQNVRGCTVSDEPNASGRFVDSFVFLWKKNTFGYSGTKLSLCNFTE